MPIEIPKKLEVVLFPRTIKEQKVELNILDVSPITTFPTPTQPAIVLAITYQRDMFPPRVVWVDREKFTIDILKEALRLDIEGTITPPEKFVIP